MTQLYGNHDNSVHRLFLLGTFDLTEQNCLELLLTHNSAAPDTWKLRRNLTAFSMLQGLGYLISPLRITSGLALLLVATPCLMDRRWRGPQGQEALKSLSSFHEYKDRLNDLPARLNCATAADVYSVYSCLHAAGKSSQVGCDAGGAFTYLQVIHQAEVRQLTPLDNLSIDTCQMVLWSCRNVAQKTPHPAPQLWTSLCQSVQAIRT